MTINTKEKTSYHFSHVQTLISSLSQGLDASHFKNQKNDSNLKKILYGYFWDNKIEERKIRTQRTGL